MTTTPIGPPPVDPGELIRHVQELIAGNDPAGLVRTLRRLHVADLVCQKLLALREAGVEIQFRQSGPAQPVSWTTTQLAGDLDEYSERCKHEVAVAARTITGRPA